MDTGLDDRLFRIFSKYSIRTNADCVMFLKNHNELIDLTDESSYVKDSRVGINLESLLHDVPDINLIDGHDYKIESETSYKKSDWIAAMIDLRQSIELRKQGLNEAIKQYEPIKKDVYYLSVVGLLTIYDFIDSTDKYSDIINTEKINKALLGFVGDVAIKVDSLDLLNKI
jgi:hypothetical protein